MSEAPRPRRRPVFTPLFEGWPFPKADAPPPAPVIRQRRAPKINPLEDRTPRCMGLPIRIG